MYCFECGKQIPDGANFCSFCGAKMNDLVLTKPHPVTETCCIDYKKQKESVRKGILVYLHDILSLEFSINKLQKELDVAKDNITIHDYWWFWRSYDLKHPIVNGPAEIEYGKLVLTYYYRQNKYYFQLAEKTDKISLFDHKGNYTNHKFGWPQCGFAPHELDKKTRERLVTLPIIKNKFFSGPDVVNSESTYWSYGFVRDNNYRLEGFAEVKSLIEEFEKTVAEREANYQKALPVFKEKIANIEKELTKAKKILNDLYSLNIIPAKYRNIGCAYFIYDFFSTSDTSLKDVFFHLDFDTIQSQLKQVINNQQKIILQQAVIIAQNEEIIAQNRRLFNELSSMNSSLSSIGTKLDGISESSIETAQWAKMAALNAEACAWIGWANYLK